MSKIFIIGDSLSVTHVKRKPVLTPGSRLAFLLAAQGYEVFVDAIGGFALAYFRGSVSHTKEGKQAADILRHAKEFQPDAIYVILGTNDYLDSDKALFAGIAAIRDSFTGPGVQPNVVFIGPPSFSPRAKEGQIALAGPRIYKALAASLRSVIDTRPMTRDLTERPMRAGDLIHFSGHGAKLWAERMAQVILGQMTVPKKTVASQVTLSQVFLVASLLDLLLRGPLSRLLWGKKERG